MHVAIIMNGNGRWMNGNGRWALERGLSPTVGCMEGAAALMVDHRGDPSPTGMPSRLHLRIVIDYSEHDSVVKSTWSKVPEPQVAESFEQRMRAVDRTALAAGAVDLLIRTGGGKCRSDFMLWEVAYARLHYANCLWPDFNAHHFQRALGQSAR